MWKAAGLDQFVLHNRSRKVVMVDERIDFPIVGIGASAGGLDAFREFFGAMPADGDVAFVLIQHLDPTRESLTAELVGAHTAMPAFQVANGMRVEPNRIYVIPPDKYLSLHEGVLRRQLGGRPAGTR